MTTESTGNLAIIEAVKKGYKFDFNDNVIGIKGKILSLSKNTKRYPRFTVSIIKNNRKIIFGVPVHRFKAYLLYGKVIFRKDVQVRHLNGNILDWKDSNISVGSASDNMFDIPKSLRVKKAKKAAKKKRKFTFEEVEIIRKMAPIVGAINISKAYKVAKSTISYIINRHTYIYD